MNKLAPDQVTAFIAMGGSFAGMGFTQPEPLNFAGHEGYVSLFDGVSLKGWDGNPKFWRAEGGAIVGESTVQNPSGNSYLVYRDIEAKDLMRAGGLPPRKAPAMPLGAKPTASRSFVRVRSSGPLQCDTGERERSP